MPYSENLKYIYRKLLSPHLHGNIHSSISVRSASSVGFEALQILSVHLPAQLMETLAHHSALRPSWMILILSIWNREIWSGKGVWWYNFWGDFLDLKSLRRSYYLQLKRSTFGLKILYTHFDIKINVDNVWLSQAYPSDSIIHQSPCFDLSGLYPAAIIG